jgi:hypothetical protein
MTRKEAFDAVFWINAESDIKLTADFTLIAAQRELTNELDRGNAVDSRDRLLQWVNRPSRDGRCMSNEDSRHIEDVPDWLLVFDNADNPELLVYYWPGSILVTSRDPMAKTHFFSTSGVDLELFDRDSVATFLQTLTGYRADADHREALITAADRCLPPRLIELAENGRIFI